MNEERDANDSDDRRDDPPARPPPPPLPPALPEARVRRSRWIGLVWAVPLAALMIVAFLGVRYLTERGFDVVVTFGTSGGARVNDTKVIYKGVEAGYVTKIEISKDGRSVDMTLRLDPRAKPVMTSTTKFWLVGVNPTLSDLQSVKAAVSGVTIGVAPGLSGSPERKFQGQDEPPIILPGTPGTEYTLQANDLGTARVSSLIFFHGQQIGKVTAVKFTAPGDFAVDIFVQAPYDKLIGSHGRFWISSPVQVSLTDKGASASFEHAGALLSGAIEFDFPRHAQGAPQSPAGAVFPLYQNQKDAETGPSGPEVPYSFRFRGPAGEMTEGAQVRLLGFQVGAVKSVRLAIDPKTGDAWTAVIAVLYPEKLHIATPMAPANAASAASAAAWRKPTDEAVGRLLANGYRARLVQSPPLIGGRLISLDPVVGAGTASLGSAEPRLIPSDDSVGGIDALTGQVNQLLSKVNRLPIEAIGKNLQDVTQRLSKLASSPQLSGSLQHLNDTMTQLDKTMSQVGPEIGPLVKKLNRAADEVTDTVAAARGLLGEGGGGGSGAGAVGQDANLPATIRELDDAARSIRSLADYLGRHPESLLRGRGSPPPSDDEKGRR